MFPVYKELFQVLGMASISTLKHLIVQRSKGNYVTFFHVLQ